MRGRVEALGRALELPAERPALEEIRRVVTIFRELRSGVTEDGKTKLKSPSGTLSTAEAISVMTQRLVAGGALRRRRARRRRRRRGHRRRGRQGPGAGPRRLARVPRDGGQGARRLGGPLPRHAGGAPSDASPSSASAITGPARRARSRARSRRLEPDAVLVEGPPEGDAIAAAGGRRGDAAAGRAARLRTRRAAAARCSIRSPPSRPSGRRCATRSRATCPLRFIDLPRPHWLGARGDATAMSAMSLRSDPLGVLAEAAGYEDAERWWEDVVEQRRDEPPPSRRCAEAMGAAARRPRARDRARGAARGAHAPRPSARRSGRASSGSPSSAAPGTRPR